ncbi:MAG: murein biosynthesis integral membrane protein MurJ [Mangrovicoccus sp.]
MKPIRLIAGFFTVGAWTMASRVLGFLRDILIAVMLGAGPVAEAFLIAFSLPNMFRRFFAEGAFNMAFVPMFSKRIEQGDDPQGFAQQAFSGLAWVLIVFSVLAIFAMPLLVLAMASGFAGDLRFGLAVDFGRVAFVYILFISLAALLSGVLNSLGQFAAAAAAPVLLNIILVTLLLTAESGVLFNLGWIAALSATGPDGLHHGQLLVVGVVLAGIAQFALLWVAARRAGFDFRLTRPRWSPDMRRLLAVAAPAALAGGVIQVNLLVGRQVASFFDGAVVWLSFADRLYQLPLGVVGIAIGVVLLPDLSRRLSAGDAAGSQAALSRAGEISLALTIPAAMALAVIPWPLVSVLFERGAFTSADSQATALAVAIYGLGLPAFVLQKVLQPLYFARENTRTPFHYALICMGLNAVIAIGFAPFFGWVAAAWATTLSAWGMVALLARGRADMGEMAQFDARFRQRIPRQILAALIMGAVLWGAAYLLTPWLEMAYWRYLALAGLIGLGGASYAIAAQLTGALSLAELKATLRRRPAPKS